MRRKLFYLPILLLFSCSSTRYYIVRHAEKEAATTMTTDVPLSQAGAQRALALKELLQDRNIKNIYSTNYVRTKSTAAPLAQQLGLTPILYEASDTTIAFLLQKIKKNTLVVGHSNTVDDIVNRLTGKQLLQDLPDTQYGDLFIVTRRGKKYFFERSQFGQ